MAASPQRLTCIRGTFRFWFGFSFVLIGVLTVLFVGGFAVFGDLPSRNMQSEMLTGAGVMLLVLVLPGGLLMLSAPRVVIDFGAGTVRDPEGTRPLSEFVGVLRHRTTRTVHYHGSTRRVPTNYIYLVPADVALDGPVDLAKVYLVEECGHGRAERILVPLVAAGLALTEWADEEPEPEVAQG